MRVARLHGTRDVRVHHEERPSAAGDEVLVRVGAVGLCGSDLHFYAEGGIDGSRVTRPFVLGHEFGGTTEDGQVVALDPALPCQSCARCREGHDNLCPDVHFAGDGRRDGGLGEWVAWPRRCLVPVPASLTVADAAMLEPLGVAIHAADLGHLKSAGSVAVLGSGPIGLFLLQVARLAGARLFATDRADRPHRLDAARALGAEVLPDEGGREGRSIFEAAGGGVDVAFEAAGENAAVDAAIEAVRPGGRVVLVGIPSEPRTSVVAGIARRKGLTILFARRMGDVYARAVRLVAEGRVDVRSMVTHRFPLSEAPAAFEAATRRVGLKVLVEP